MPPPLSKYLPTECLEAIFSEIDPNDYCTLHSIILVNRKWCESGIQMLWRKPLNCNTIPIERLMKILPSYLAFVDQHDVDNKPLFNYPAFLRELNYNVLYKLVEAWIQANEPTKEDCLDIDGTEFFTGNTFEERRFQIANEICKVVILSQGGLDYFNVNLYPSFEKTTGHVWFEKCARAATSEIPSFLAASNCFADLETLVCNDFFNTNHFFIRLSQYAHSIQDLTISINCRYSLAIRDTRLSPFDMPLSNKNIEFIHLINAQRKLKKLKIENGNFVDISEELSLIFNNHLTKSLEKLEINGGMLSEDSALEGLLKCKNLEQLSFENFTITPGNLNSLAMTIFPKLNSIRFINIDRNWNQDPRNVTIHTNLVALIGNSNERLTSIFIYIKTSYCLNLLTKIAENCPNLVNFGTYLMNDQNAEDLLILLKTCRKLKSLKIPKSLELVYANAEDDAFQDSRLFQLYKYFPKIAENLPACFENLNVAYWAILGKYFRGFLDKAPAGLTALTWAGEARAVNKHENLLKQYAKKNGKRVKYFRINKLYSCDYAQITAELE
ncbi:6837_t:CDS:1 [Ambispora leptoticha]|uniref:6837_t:CDS:1 n=1 Tax=Ambispora leptoticha TaxID=144679 RepID=A0A9N8VEZ2_9GLOM|nr:6837_t:CDS:1 [Ambispora leptoticha]